MSMCLIHLTIHFTIDVEDHKRQSFEGLIGSKHQTLEVKVIFQNAHSILNIA
jgi:hypothetical protein